ncbi:sensor histidine kinase [Ketogulonicigenium vulgare]|uniref:histidine kinase n=1 Tax=Ketogulonicigenium vulgare (strain WSH-001) TaxID=759362 RepID=F9Y559_KETVW|nr:ATP-binding protein [Ketogulonicigenium vulgare]ADO42492.1 Probable two-component sensor histidine kinase [Ketogulonicigenium vulgare Y25]AEM40691.1 Alkaline phosphatase synthesis sensor protein PhoR [Ketogulonicigenium vulgare WSH-001]ALJ80861.1 PAS domain-containing sensor histidine kinase [Ketogulonicigenium vulgare]ANW33637.1 two-component sensor histidine kinase [Ketogulonicigenium vulgare]AOZ54405.1 two-component sensor histidine kinase [Ketogulonicigenium vulgare]
MPDNLNAIIGALDLPALIISPEGQIIAHNAAARDLIGMDMVGLPHAAVLRQPAVSAAVDLVLSGAPESRARLTQRGASRDSIWQMRAAAFEGQRRAILVTFTDLTAVEEANQIRRDFVANVSHELRTPLTAIMGFIETLRGPARDDPGVRGRFLDIMEREANRMVQLVDGLLSLSRVEVDERVRPTTPVDLKALAEETIAALEPLAAQGNNTVTLHAEPGNWIVPGDIGQLHQVLRNLVQNALKYGGPDKNVVIALHPAQFDVALRATAVRIDVQDEGPGIEAHHIPRLTERFYRVDAHRARTVGGSGLGLAIVKHIVNRHRGRLAISSTPEKGSTFSVLLPQE